MIEHHCQVDIFYVAIDLQLQELNTRFNEQTIELLRLSTSLLLKNAYGLFNIDHICNFVKKFYPTDFSDQEKNILRYQL